MKIKTLGHYKKVKLVLGDQLNLQHSWWQSPDPDALVVLVELKQEADYAWHHIQKHVAFFAAMESFAKQLQALGHCVLYLNLDDTAQYSSLNVLLSDLFNQTSCRCFEYQRPDEYRLAEQLTQIAEQSNLDVKLSETEHFLLPFDDIASHFTPNKKVLMENFYRKMRKRFGYLMADAQTPLADKWNFDAQNRNKFKAQDLAAIPAPLLFQNPTAAILDRLSRHQISNFGEIGEQLLWPVNRHQALNLLAHFCQLCLPKFGEFQDAMTEHSEHSWSLYHSRLSFALNCKILSPKEVIETAIEHFEAHPDHISIAQIEGFVRQILGWREYIRGIYWANMPNYQHLNHFAADRDLPEYYWSANTKMSCMKSAIEQTRQTAYAHHIQRLMVTGNFALLTGIDPSQVDHWYLSVYIDAIEWVEMPNTRGMALFADGGIIATKPYAASGSYINRMSDHCKACHYKVKDKVGEKACPFNSLYWHFMTQHREQLSRNPRIGMIYRSWDKMDSEVQQQVLQTAQHNLNRLQEL